MNKMFSLIKASLTQDMSLFKVKSNRTNGKSKILVPIILAAVIMLYMGVYSISLLDQFKEAHLEYVALALLTFIFAMINIFEGIYKSSSLLFNCKDDQLLLSLPISKNTVLFLRMFKFYLFELLFGGLFTLPGIVTYAMYTNPSWTYWLVSIVALLLLPIVPIVIGCVIGFFVTYISSKFKGKNIIQTILTMIFGLSALIVSFSFEEITESITKNGEVINNFIGKWYYPVGAYISLVRNFDLLTFILYIVINILIFGLAILFIGKFYFRLNSSIKGVTVVHNKKPYVVKIRSKARSFIKKEFSKFFQTPVFIVNAGFGLVMFLTACIVVCANSNSFVEALLTKIEGVTANQILSYVPVIMVLLVSVSSFMTSITSSMISLEGKSFGILKSLPVKSSMIVLYKVLTSLVIIVPCLLVGDIIIFVYFKFDILNIILVLYASVLLPFITELIGIVVNLKFPKMDASNDTEIVKQSMSSFISVMIGMALSMVSGGIVIGLIIGGLSSLTIEILYLVLFTILALILWFVSANKAEDMFNKIQS